MHKQKISVSQTKAVLCIILLLFSVLLGAIHVGTAAGDNQSPKVPILAADGVDHRYNTSGTSEFWHAGINTSTPEVDINYTTTQFEKASKYNPDQMGSSMKLSYHDGSKVTVEFIIGYCFHDGGLDIANKRVLNWSKLIGCGGLMYTDELINNSHVATSYMFTGFDIINGSATGPTTNWTNASMILGQINYGNIDYGNGSHHNASIKIGIVDLSTRDYTSNGTVLKESIANFSVTINAALSRLPLTAVGAIDIPVVLKFHVTHNITQTAYKYGLDINWSANKNFPTAFPMTTGNNYSILAEDHLGVCYTSGPDTISVPIFNTNPANDTATWLVNGTVFGTQYYTTQYYINGTDPPLQTKRYYETKNLNHNKTSFVAVWFTGFQYNISTGFSFDPKVVLYNSIPPTSPDFSNPIVIPVQVIIGIIVVVIAVIAISISFLWIRRKKRAKPL